MAAGLQGMTQYCIRTNLARNWITLAAVAVATAAVFYVTTAIGAGVHLGKQLAGALLEAAVFVAAYYAWKSDRPGHLSAYDKVLGIPTYALAGVAFALALQSFRVMHFPRAHYDEVDGASLCFGAIAAAIFGMCTAGFSTRWKAPLLLNGCVIVIALLSFPR